MDISIVIPVYNEEAALPETLKKIAALREKLSPLKTEVIFIEDCSTDGSRSILESAEGVTLIKNPYNLGYGTNLKRGIKQATGKWILITDADGTYPIERAIDFVPYMEEYDMIVGARKRECNNTFYLRRPAKKILNAFASFLASFHIPDLNSGMRMFKKDLSLEFWNLYPKRFSFTSTITMAFIKSNYLIKYIPIDYYKRVGSSSIKPWNFFTFMGIAFRIAFYFEPLKFLLPISALLCVSSFIKGGYDLMTQNIIGNFSILVFILGTMTGFLAVLADLLFRQRK